MLERFDGSANIVSGPLGRPWNVRELTILDPDGYQLAFTAPLNTNLGFEEIVKRASGGK